MTADAADPGDYDAILVVGFGGPERREDVIPFLENVLRGRNVPRERMLEVAEHYYHFDGVSPINAQVRDLIAALRPELDRRGIGLPIYWGNRNWHPMLADTVRADGRRRRPPRPGRRPRRLQLVFELPAVPRGHPAGPRGGRRSRPRSWTRCGSSTTTPTSSPPTPTASATPWIRSPPDRRDRARLAFTAHSIPASMADSSRYVAQLDRDLPAGRRVGRRRPRPLAARLPEPERTADRPLARPRHRRPPPRPARPGASPTSSSSPIGFLSDHMEVLYDLDDEARHACEAIGLNMVRAGTVGTHPAFVAMLGELIEERLAASPDRRAIGRFGPSHDVCPVDCCLPPARPQARPA